MLRRSESVPCPVEFEDREWIEGRFAWLADEFGWERLRQARVILPTPEFFPDSFDETEESARVMLARICGYMGVAAPAVELALFTNEPSFVSGIAEAAGVYEDRRDGRCRVWIETAQLLDPLSLASTMTHEVGHFLLLGGGRITEDHEDHEPLTDLLTVFLGLGVLRANATIRDRTSGFGAYTRRHAGSYGYLTMPQYGYALALFARERRELHPPWVKELRPDVRAAFHQATRYVNEAGEIHWRPLSPAAQPRPDASKREHDYRARCTYCGVEISPELANDLSLNQAEDADADKGSTEPMGKLGVCEACRSSIEENYEGLTEDLEIEEGKRRFLRFVFGYLLLPFVAILLVVWLVAWLFDF